MVKKTAIGLVAGASVAFFSFNLGIDFGIDAGWCVGFDSAGGHESVPVEEDDFCQRVQPDKAPVSHFLRSAYLHLIGQNHS